MTVLADEVSEEISGEALDRCLVDIFAQEIDNRKDRKGKESITKNINAMIRLLSESNRVKEILSASKETTLYVEGLLEGNDF